MKNLLKTGSKHIKDLNSLELTELQILLNNWGYNLIVDGILGKKTENAFFSFKKNHQLTEPYFFGKTTLDFLLKKTTRRTINKEGLSLIKEFEGFSSKAYLCPSGIWTIGYGSTFYRDGSRVKKGDYLSEKEADRLLRITVESFSEQVAKLIRVPVSNNQFASLVSLTYNIGLEAFKNSTMLSMLNNKMPKNDIALQFLRWNKANGKALEGLSRRRESEMRLFLQ